MAVITISRQSGSEGLLIAQLLCERLGYKYFDKKLMADLGKGIGLKPGDIIDTAVEHNRAKSWLERAFANYQLPFNDPVTWATGAGQDTREVLSVQQVRKLIQVAYEQGNVVIVGRGGQMVLANKPDVLHVRVIAPLATRVQRWQEREGINAEEARTRVHERDQAHVDFVRRFFDADVNDPAHYDLTISTEKITPGTAVDLIVKTLETITVKV